MDQFMRVQWTVPVKFRTELRSDMTMVYFNYTTVKLSKSIYESIVILSR